MVLLKSRFSKVIFAQALLAGLSAGVGNCWATNATPITLNGWNADVIYVPGASNTSVQGFDGEGVGSYAWYMNGTYSAPDYYLNTGLPITAGVLFSSTPTNTVAAGQTEFIVGSATAANNALKLGAPAITTNTLALADPAGYNNLAILAASGNTGITNYTNAFTFTLTFSDNTTSGPITYYPYDWGQGNRATSQTAQEIFGAVGRTQTANTYPVPVDAGYFSMYETDINLTTLTSLAGVADNSKYIKSITFSEPSVGRVGVFAVSGVVNTSATDPAAPMPEPAALALLATGAAVLLLRRGTCRQ